MRKILALIVARNREFYRDRSALTWSLLFPFIVLTGFAYGYSGRQDPILKITVFPESAMTTSVAKAISEIPGIELHGTSDEVRALRSVQRYESDLFLRLANGGQTLHYALNLNSSKGKLAERLLADAVARLPEPKPRPEVKPVEGRPIRYADWLLPGLLAMNMMFGSMFGVGYVIVRYRKNGVLKRLRATPLSAFQFLLAQVVSRMLLMLVTSFIVLGGAIGLIGFQPQGSWIDLTLFVAISSAAMISLGLIVAARIASEEVADGVLNLMTWPMIFLSGVWFSIEGASSWVIYGSRLMPLTHVVDGMRAILIDGAGIGQLSSQVTVLVVLSLVFIGIGSVIFRWR